MRAVKIVAYVVGGLIALLVVLLIGVGVFVDPNHYRDQISQRVKTATGRDLTLTGDLHLSVFPWIAIGLGPATLSDAPGFGKEPFASIQEAKVSVKLLPLLRGRIEVGKVRLSGVQIRLITNAHGVHNWSDLTQPKPGAAAERPGSSTSFAGVGGIEIEKSTIIIDDEQAKTHQALKDFFLQTGAIGAGETSKVETHFSVEQSADASMNVRATTSLNADLDAGRYLLKDTQLEVTLFGQGKPAKGIPVSVKLAALEADTGKKLYAVNGLEAALTWAGEGLPQSGIPITLQAAKANADLGKQTLSTEGVAAVIAGVQAKLALNGEEILDAPKFSGKLAIAPVSLREVMPKVGMTVPVTADTKVLTQLSLESDLQATKTSASLDNLVLKLDDTTLRGTLGIADFTAQALRFDLNVDRINLDRYRAPQANAPANDKAAAGPPTEIPVETLRKLNARGVFKIGQAIFSNLKFENLELNVNARDGDVKLAPLQAAMYGGRYRGSVGIDAKTPVAALALDADVSDVNFAPLFKDMFKTERISGKGHLGAKLQAKGKTTDAWFNSLGGTLEFKIADGAVEGTDLWYEIRRARALLRQQAPPPAPSPARTAFTSLQGTGRMTNGVLANNDLVAATQYLRINGEGNVNLVDNTLDYRLNTVVMKIPQQAPVAAEERELVDAEIPVRVTGSLSAPKVRPDIETFLKNEVRNKVEEKVKDKLKDKLRGILGR